VYSTVIQFHVINFLILRGNCTTMIVSVFSYKVINKVSRKSCGPKRHEVTGEYIRRSFMICTPQQILFGWTYRK